MVQLKFDHIIHYIKNIDEFEYPGEVIKLSPGALHKRYGTKTKLVSNDISYIEIIGEKEKEKIKMDIKPNEGRETFIGKMEKKNLEQGVKALALQK
ncbi:VOC family protein, partial [Staphylococcus simulans]